MSHPAAPRPRASRRRLVFSIVWAVIGALIAASLLKLAFFNAGPTEALQPSGGLSTPMASVERGTVVNSFQITGSVAADPGVPVRATEAGTITDVFVKDGAQVTYGQALFDVREQVGQTNPEPPAVDPESTAPPPPAPTPEPIYQYYTITAPATGVLSGFAPLVKQQVAIGEQLGQIGPGTFTVVADLTAANQYRMLDQPTSATVTISGGPAPFECGDLKIGAPPSANGDGKPGAPAQAPSPDPFAPGDGTGGTGGTGNVTGQVRCAVPADQRVFAGLNATVEIVAGTAENVLVVPVTAVKGDYATGVVFLPGDGGKPQEVRVGLGLTDGTIIEVRSGLEEGQRILQYVPSEVPLHDGGFGPDPGFGDGGTGEEAPADEAPADEAPADEAPAESPQP